MKKLTAIVTGFIAAGALLFLGCQNMTMPPVSASAGYGNVVVSFSAGRAALSPAEMDFDTYEFIFTMDGMAESFDRNKGEDFIFSLPAGNGYTLEVKCYAGGKADENLAAAGTSGTFNVSSNDVTPVLVKLNGVLSGGQKGFFTWSVTYPADAEIANMFLMAGAETFSLPTGNTAGELSGEYAADAGWYFLVLRFEREREEAGYANGVVIYPGQTTHFEWTFTNDDFSIPPNDGEIIFKWNGFDIEGYSHYGKTNFDPGFALGKNIEIFIDDDGGINHNVLKLTPPDGGYDEGTVIMTHATGTPGTYTLSMLYWVEPGQEIANFYWQNTGGSYGQTTYGQPDGAWRVFGGDALDGDVAVSGGWYQYSKSIYLMEKEEIGLLARSTANGAGIRDAVIYIRDINLSWEYLPIDISPTEFNLAVNRTKTLKTAYADAAWTSSNPGVAAVENGVVTAVSPGTAVITATSSYDGANTAASAVTVVAAGSKTIALTFDDGPLPYSTPDFLDVLKAKGATATFFTIGYLVDAYPDIAKRIVNEGHEIGNHTYYHNESYQHWWDNGKFGMPADHMPPPEAVPALISWNTFDGIRNELIRTQNAVARATAGSAKGSVVPTVFRAPALLYTSDADPSRTKADHWAEEIQYCDILEDVTASMGLALIDTTGHAEGDYDWNTSINTGPDSVFKKVQELAADWGILLLHDAGIPERVGTRANVLEALPRILDWLFDEGYEVLSVNDVVKKRNNGTLIPGEIYYRFSHDEQFNPGAVANVSGVSVSPSSLVFNNPRDTKTLTASVNGTFSQNVYWYSDNTDVAAVDYSGNTVTVTAVGPGTAVIRAVAADRSSVAEVTVLVTFNTITAWNNAAISLAGRDGMATDGTYWGSRGRTDVLGSHQLGSSRYTNVFKLAPPSPSYGGDYYWGPADGGSGGSLALTFEIPYDGEYTLSMDGWIENPYPSYSPANLVFLWWAAHPDNEWVEVSRVQPAPTGEWISSSGTVELKAGMTIGLLARDTGDATGLKGATAYVKNLKLTMTDGINDIINITSTATPVSEKTIEFVWDDSGTFLITTTDSLTLHRANGDTAALTGPAGATSYQWYVGGRPVTGANSRSFTFDSMAYEPGRTYNVSLWANGVGGDFVAIRVE